MHVSMLVLSVSAFVLAVTCELCDGFSVGPYGRSPFGVAYCTAPDTFIEADGWPKAGEVRRDSFTRDCIDVKIERAFVDVPDGLTNGELFALTAGRSTRFGRPLKEVRQAEFIGRHGDWSYRYSLSYDEEGRLTGAAGTVESKPISSRLITSALAPTIRPVGGTVLHIDCDSPRRTCELSPSTEGDYMRRLITIKFDAKSPDGILCAQTPGARFNEPAPTVDLYVGDKRVATGATDDGGVGEACYGAQSADALAALSQARTVTYRVARANGEPARPSDEIEFDVEGLPLGLALAQRLYTSEITGQGTRARTLQVERTADKILSDGGSGR